MSIRWGRFLALLAFAVVLAASPTLRAADPKPAGPLELIPDDAVFAVGVRNLKELHERGDKFIEASRFRIEDTYRPSQLLLKLFDFLGVKKGLDEKGPAAVVLPNFKSAGIEQLKEPDMGYAFVVLRESFSSCP